MTEYFVVARRLHALATRKRVPVHVTAVRASRGAISTGAPIVAPDGSRRRNRPDSIRGVNTASLEVVGTSAVLA